MSPEIHPSSPDAATPPGEAIAAVPVPSRAALSEHEGPRCEGCDYDLTGLTSQYCPECGRHFDLGLMIRGPSPLERPATPWDRDAGFEGFIETWGLAAFSPKRLATNFPARHSAIKAIIYSSICLALATASLLVLVFVCVPAASVDSMSLAYSLATCLGLLTGLYLALSRVPHGLAKRCPPLYAPWSYHFWRGLILYSSGFLLVVAAAAGLLTIAIWGDYTNSPAGQARLTVSADGRLIALPAPSAGLQEWFLYLSIGALVAALLWWWIVTGMMARVRLPQKADRGAAYMLIVWGFIEAMLAGAAVGAVSFLPLYSIVELAQHLSGSGG